jgi:hypothetical protein
VVPQPLVAAPATRIDFAAGQAAPAYWVTRQLVGLQSLGSWYNQADSTDTIVNHRPWSAATRRAVVVLGIT